MGRGGAQRSNGSSDSTLAVCSRVVTLINASTLNMLRVPAGMVHYCCTQLGYWCSSMLHSVLPRSRYIQLQNLLQHSCHQGADTFISYLAFFPPIKTISLWSTLPFLPNNHSLQSGLFVNSYFAIFNLRCRRKGEERGWWRLLPFLLACDSLPGLTWWLPSS